MELKTRPSQEYQSIDGAWHPTAKAAEAVNAEWSFPFANGADGPSTVNKSDAFGTREMRSCAGCKHYAVHRFTIDVAPVEASPASFLHEAEDYQAGYVSHQKFEYCWAKKTGADCDGLRTARITTNEGRVIAIQQCPRIR